MEKKDKYLLKNRPMVENLNKANQSWGLHTQNGINAISVVLCALFVLFAILFFVGGSKLFGFIFLGIVVLIAVSAFVAKLLEKENQVRRAEKKDSLDAIFKEHEE